MGDTYRKRPGSRTKEIAESDIVLFMFDATIGGVSLGENVSAGEIALMMVQGVSIYVGSLILFAVLVHGAGVLYRKVFRRKTKRKRENSPGEGVAILGRMKRQARTTLLLTPSTGPRFSKLGGDPELPDSIVWPQGVKAPRAFLAQIDLSEVQGAELLDWLPAEGRIYAFYDEWRLGFRDVVQIISSTEAPGPARTPPAGFSPKLRFPERRAGFLPMKSTPSLDWLGIDVQDMDVSDEELDTLADMPNAPFGDELQHRIGGYPSEIQNSNMRLECEHLARGLEFDYSAEVEPAIERASKSWRLLLQIDSDPALKMNWGDGGMHYVFIRAQHARAGDFSRTVTISQSY